MTLCSSSDNIRLQVSKTAVKTTTSLTKLLSNDDLARHIPTLIRTMNMPSRETQAKAIHDLRYAIISLLLRSVLF